jgi:hypothetical protein
VTAATIHSHPHGLMGIAKTNALQDDACAVRLLGHRPAYLMHYGPMRHGNGYYSFPCCERMLLAPAAVTDVRMVAVGPGAS